MLNHSIEVIKVFISLSELFSFSFCKTCSVAESESKYVCVWIYKLLLLLNIIGLRYCTNIYHCDFVLKLIYMDELYIITPVFNQYLLTLLTWSTPSPFVCSFKVNTICSYVFYISTGSDIMIKCSTYFFPELSLSMYTCRLLCSSRLPVRILFVFMSDNAGVLS